jgi:hypothetical protein
VKIAELMIAYEQHGVFETTDDRLLVTNKITVLKSWSFFKSLIRKSIRLIIGFPEIIDIAPVKVADFDFAVFPPF